MPRGGSREKAGRKSTWKSGCKFEDTKSIRVPAHIADQVLEIAHKLDAGESILPKEVKPESKVEQVQQIPFLLMDGDSALVPVYVPVSIAEQVERYAKEQKEKSGVACPACGSPELRLDGRSSSGKQRYLCKRCKKKFAASK
jgi:DNA-directed RNA polymerase subunit RPC12/RpoP